MTAQLTQESHHKHRININAEIEDFEKVPW
jgi:hypothetical protein